MIKDYLYFFLICLLFGYQSFGQELKLFTTNDFDLNGKVKKCTVITDYGQEVFEFDENGLLLKSITAYNEADQDITSYKYANGFLLEKRMESYKDNVLDESSSMANFYKIDTTKQKIVREQIISYDKEFVELQEYVYGEEDRIFKVTTSHENAVDETRIEYSTFKNETTKTYFVNGVIEKSIRTSIKKSKSGIEQKIILTKEYVDGEPNKAVEQRFDENGILIYEELFLSDNLKGGFASQEIRQFKYNTDGVLEKEVIKKGKAVSEKEFIFQFDDNENKNWVKKITTPENTYITRKIEYYPPLEVEEQPE
ncbi:hypothetical protein MTsPCn9_08390 [Croceitalea sp. MTPC9]|uniref:hypothetical protein n=1 Tax=unclassified Croceitalea TaxID=2632280 RepID=UPI002B3D5EA6|nr:hypothetical protein MTsPCn6_00320 [Croceitalea sp. MTPC6]GMN15903.1 hypothetical protein MTsPCn9_08390 [Croceitalea sp. MTPC9]